MNFPDTLYLNQDIIIRILVNNSGCLVEFPKSTKALKLNKIGLDIIRKSMLSNCNVSYWKEKIGSKDALEILKKLCKLKVLLPVQPIEKNQYAQINEKWLKSEWENDLEYFKSTLDMKFLDYSPGGTGYKVQSDNMIKWGDENPDTNRTKFITSSKSIIKLPSHNDIKQISNKKCLLSILSLANCQTKEKKIYWKGSPLIRRSVPSGGSRHPIETYLISNNLDEIPKGTYHINISSPELRCISQDKWYESSYGFDGLLLFTAVYARNMYRYREPRTFRSVHMDAGHLLEMNRLLLSNIGYETQISFSGIHEFEDLLEIDGVSESFVGAIGFKI